mgnify:CR=1 FL=1
MKKNALLILSNESSTNFFTFNFPKQYKIINVFYEDYDLIELQRVKAIFVDSRLDLKKINELENFCLNNNIAFYLYPVSLDLRKRKIKAIDDSLFLYLKPYSLSRIQKIIKRLFDFFASLLIIIILLPLLLLITLLIKIFDKGPAFYYQERLTEGERKFVIIKFRTMKVNAEKETGKVLATADDPRLTKIGKVLRKYRLDELPQIFNVLIGDMSLVGPRPEREFFVNDFKKKDDYYKFRFNVKAGITGLAQIYAKYDSNFKTKLDYDLYYISNYSVWLDLKILFKTIIYLLKIKKTSIYKYRTKENENYSN